MKNSINKLDQMGAVKWDYLKCPLHRYTFSRKPLRNWIEQECEGKVLNLFAGKTKLSIDEVRNDLSKDTEADYHDDALVFLQQWSGAKFNTVILDPPYSYRKSMELYNGVYCSQFQKIKQEIPNVLATGGKVITLGYHSVVMGRKRGFEIEKLCLISHGGAIHDTIISVERMYNQLHSETL